MANNHNNNNNKTRIIKRRNTICIDRVFDNDLIENFYEQHLNRDNSSLHCEECAKNFINEGPGKKILAEFVTLADINYYLTKKMNTFEKLSLLKNLNPDSVIFDNRIHQVRQKHLHVGILLDHLQCINKIIDK